MADLQGRAALVTGGSSGIGRAICFALAGAGMTVVAASNEVDLLPALVEELGQSGHQAHSLPVDLSEPAQVPGLFARAEDLAGPIHLLVNNAGIGLQATVEQTSEERLRRIFEVNFFAVTTLCREALARMGARGDGHILNISSASARRGLPRASAYASSKAAVHAFTQSLRIEAHPLGVQVSEILPISVRTSFFGRSDNLAEREYRPRGLVQTPEYVARLVVDCARRPRPEITSSLVTHWLLSLQAAFPNILEPAVRYLSQR